MPKKTEPQATKAPYTVQITPEHEAEIVSLITELKAMTGVSKSRLVSEALVQSLKHKKNLLKLAPCN